MPGKADHNFVALAGRKSWTVPVAMAVGMLFAACSGGSSPPVASPDPSATVGKSEENVPPAANGPSPDANMPFAPVFSISAVNGEEIRLEDILGSAPVYVLFVPGVDDELDRAQLRRIQARYAQFEMLGAKIFVIASDQPAKVLGLRDELGLEFPLIADPINVIASEWQVFDLFGKGKSGPASFVFDTHGTLIARLIAAEPDDRPTVEEVLQVIEESLSAGSA